MSVIQTLRGKGSTVVTVLLIVALVAFLLMDSVSSKISTMFQEDRTMMGEINGERIETQDYNKRLQDIEDYTKNQNKSKSLTEQERNTLQEQVWMQMVNEKLIGAEMDALGIDVSDKEFQDMMTNAQFADDMVKQNFSDPNTGMFDPNRVVQYEQQLAQQNDPVQIKQWDNFKESLAKQRKVNKYLTIVKNGIYIPQFMLDESASQQNKMANISYVLAPYSIINDTEIKVSDAEIKEFMNARESVYRNLEDKASFDYVSFPIIASSADTVASLGFLNKIKDEFASSEDAESYASDNSDELVDDKFYNENTLENTNKSNLIAASVGTVVGPYYDNKAYKLSKVVAKKSMPDSVKASRIFIAYREDRNEAQAKTLTDSIEAALKSGANFAQIAQTRSDDEATKAKGGDMGFVSKNMIEPKVADEIFKADGQKLKVVRTNAGYQILRISEQKSFKPNVQLVTIAKSMLPSEKTIQVAYNKALDFKNAAKDEASFKAAAKKAGMDKRIAQNITKTQSIVQGLGNVRSLVRWAYEAEVGNISNVMSFEDKCIVARLSSKINKGEMGDINVFRTEIESQLKRKKKAEAIAAKVSGTASIGAIAKMFSTEVKTADSIKMQQMTPGNLGYEPKVTGAAMNKNLINKVSKGIAGEQGVFFIKVNNVVDNTKTAQRIPGLERMQAQMQYMQTIDQLIPTVLRKKADVKDNRSLFY